MRARLRAGALTALVLLSACHQRFRDQVDTIDAVRAVPTTPVQPDVDLARIWTADPGMVGLMADSYNLSQMIREGRMSAVIAEKLDAQGVSAAFVYGLREGLGEGPPFAETDDATAKLTLEVVDWGLDVSSSPFPAVFTYKVRVRGVLPDGDPFYRASFRCTGDAGEAKWIDGFGWASSRDERDLRALPAARIQETFDKAAYQCGQDLAGQLRYHAGYR